MDSIMSMSRDELYQEIADYKKEMERRIQNNDLEPSFVIGGRSYTNEEWKKLLNRIDKEIDDIKEEQKVRFEKDDPGEHYRKLEASRKSLFNKLTGTADKNQVPYSHLAENGIIQYKGATFVCDELNQAICLGDMSERSKVLNISLENGGRLMVNVDNLDELLEAIDMFTPEDIKRILDAIATYKKQKEMELEVDACVDKLISDKSK